MNTNSLPDGAQLLRTRDVAAVLGISEVWAKKMIQRGMIKSITIGRARRVPRVWLDELIERRMAEAQGEAA